MASEIGRNPNMPSVAIRRPLLQVAQVAHDDAAALLDGVLHVFRRVPAIDSKPPPCSMIVCTRGCCAAGPVRARQVLQTGKPSWTYRFIASRRALVSWNGMLNISRAHTQRFIQQPEALGEHARGGHVVALGQVLHLLERALDRGRRAFLEAPHLALAVDVPRDSAWLVAAFPRGELTAGSCFVVRARRAFHIRARSPRCRAARSMNALALVLRRMAYTISATPRIMLGIGASVSSAVPSAIRLPQRAAVLRGGVPAGPACSALPGTRRPWCGCSAGASAEHVRVGLGHESVLDRLLAQLVPLALHHRVGPLDDAVLGGSQLVAELLQAALAVPRRRCRLRPCGRRRALELATSMSRWSLRYAFNCFGWLLLSISPFLRSRS